MKNSSLIALAVMLLIACGIIYLQWKSASLAQRDRNLEAKEFRNRQDEHLSVINRRDAEISILINERHEDSVSHAKNQGALKARLNALRARVIGPAVVQDTIIVYQDSLIADLVQQRDTLYITDKKVIDSLQRSNLELSELFKGQLKESIKLSGELQREKKKRFSVGPSVSYGFRGADVGISVQYSLFRF